MSEDVNHDPSAPVPPPEAAGASYPTLEEMAGLLPQYEMHEIIGVGGMGAVYKGRQAALDRWVAIKLLPVSAAQNAEDAERFIKEARSMARLVHPHIVAVFDFGQTRDGHLYLVMEYVEGSDLHRRTRAREVTNDRARQVIFQICDALQFAHDRGVVHRDIKPANILITDQWQAKLADFGLARELSGTPNSDEPEYGTPDYTAPERLIVGAVVDHRADIYALGVVMHEMLTGKTPQAVADKPTGKSLPAEFAKVVARCLLPNPDRRYQKASEIKAALIEALAEKKRQETTPPNPGTASASAPALNRPPPRTSAIEGVKQVWGPILWGLASVVIVVSLGWAIVLNRLRQQETTGGSAPRNTTAGAGDLAVFAPPKPPAQPEPAKTLAPTPPPSVEPPVLEPPPAMAATDKPKEIEEPLMAPPTVPLSQPYLVEEGEPGEIARFKGHKESVYAIRLMNDQRRVVSGGYDGTVRVWDVLTQSELLRVDSGVGSVSRLVLNADQTQALVSSGSTDRMAILDLTSGKVIASTAMPNDRLSQVVFAPDGRTVLAGSTAPAGTNLFRWDPAKDTPPEPIAGVEAWLYEMFALPGELQGRVLLNGSIPYGSTMPNARRSVTSILDTNTNTVTSPQGFPPGSRMSLSRDSTRLMLIGASISILRLPELKVANTIPVPPGPNRPLVPVFVGEGHLVATVWNDLTLRLFEVESGQEVYNASLGQRPSDLAVSADGRWAVISTSRLTKDTPKPGDFDLILWRLPKSDQLTSTQSAEALARQQMDDLAKHDPELARLRTELPTKLKLPAPVDKAAQMQTLNAQYIAALRRTAQSQPPTEQRALLAEVDLLALGGSLPAAGMDVSVTPILARLRGIYRSQLATLETQQQQVIAQAVKEVEAYFAPLRQQRERTNDRVGLARLGLVVQALTGSSPAPQASITQVTVATTPQAAGTPVKRPDRPLTVFVIERVAKNTYTPSDPIAVSRIPGDLGPVVAITGGRSHALALLPDGRVRGWGTWEGQEITVPTDATGIVRLDSSDESALALRADGKIVAWGPGSPGQVWSPPPGKAPMDICAGSNSAGFALCTDGSVYSTHPSSGRTAETSPPSDLGPVVRLAYAPGSGFCAILKDGTARFWGEIMAPLLPLPTDLRDLSLISFSERYAVAMQKDGTMNGWGDLAPGQRFRIRRFTGSLGVSRDPSHRLFPVHRGDHAWELVPNPSIPDYLAEDRVSVIEGRLRGCFDALFTEYHVLGLRPQ